MDTNLIGLQICQSCNNSGNGKYCTECGQPYATRPITLKGLIHDMFHFFTHFEKGFGYTLKQLIVAPGAMQRKFIDGERSRHQRPFSMFFICASVNALARFWIYETLARYYHSDSLGEASFFHQYMVFLYTILMPFIALITWIFFYRSRYNYAETIVVLLYHLAFIFLAVTVIALLKFIWPDLETTYVELPMLITYTIATFVNLYNNSNRWVVALKGVVWVIVIFMTVHFFQDLVQRLVK